MSGSKRAFLHFALVALFLRAMLPAGWMPAAHGDAPLVMCSVVAKIFRDSHAGDAVPGKDDPRAHESCALSATPGVAAPDNMIFFTPVLQEDDLHDFDDPQPVHSFSHGPAPQAPRAPPQPLI